MLPTSILALVLAVFPALSASARPERPKRSLRLPTGIEMAFVEAGRADGPALVLLHGYTDTSRSWAPTIDALVERGTALRVVAPDLRGHGASTLPAEAGCAAAPERCFAVTAFARDVLALFDALGIETAHVAGHSMGSVIAQELALTHPERVQSLVLVGSFAQGLDSPFVHDFLLAETLEGRWKAELVRARSGFRWPTDAYCLTPRDVAPGVAAWMREQWVADPTADPALLDAICADALATPLGTWLGAIRALGALDHRERLARLAVPTLVIWGTQDAACPASAQAELRAALDAAVAAGRTRYAFKTYGARPLAASGMQDTDLGHNLLWGAPAPLAADLEAFCASGAPTRARVSADPRDPRRLRVEPGRAAVLVREPRPGAAPRR